MHQCRLVGKLLATSALSLALMISSATASTPIGTLFEDDTFRNPVGGVDSRFTKVAETLCDNDNNGTNESCSWSIQNSHQHMRIAPGYKSRWGGPQGKDAGIAKAYDGAVVGEHYSATARVALQDFSLQYFKPRLTIAATNSSGSVQYQECNQEIKVPEDIVSPPFLTFVTVTIPDCELIDGRTSRVVIKVRASAQHPEAYGTVILDYLRFVHCASSCLVPQT